MNTDENESFPPAPAARRASVAPAAFAVAPGSVAPVGRRVAAFALDVLTALVAVGIGYAVMAVTGAQPGSPVLLLPLVLGLGVGVGQWVAEARTGATVGSALLGIRTLSATTGKPAGLLVILIRQLVVGLGTLACGIGEWVVVASGAWDRTPVQQGWHDKAAGTVVLRAHALRRQAATRGSAASVPWSSAVARAVEPGRAATGPVPRVPVTGASPVVPAAPPAPAGPPAWAVSARPLEHVAPIHSVPDAPAADPVVLDALPPAPVIDTPPPTRRTRLQARADRTRDLEAEAPPLRPAEPDLGELEHTRLRAAAEPAAAPGVRLRFDTGEQVDVTGDGLIGRNPNPEAGVDHVVAIDDPERSISKVHLAFGLEADGRLWVMDRGSTNGTVVVAPDGHTAVLVAGSRVTVTPGWTVRFGRRTVQVARQ